MAVDIQVKVNVQENDAIEKLERIRAASEGLESKDITININTTGLDNITTKSVKAVNAYANLVRASVNYTNAEKAQYKAETQRIKAQASDKSADARIMKEKRLTEALNGRTKSTKTLVEEEEKAIKHKGFLERALGKPVGEYLMNRAAYMAVTESIRAVTTAFKDALATMKEVDSELASIQKVTDFSAEQMKVIEQGAYSVASKYGVSAQEYLESVSAFAKAGYKDLADDLGELAIKTQLVGDVNASTANQFLLSVDAAWKMRGSVEDLSKVLDEANVVENNYATSIDKLAQGMPNVASVASMVGMSAEETIAALGTITAVTQQSGTKAATALRALILNIMKDTTTEVEEGVTVTKEQVSTLDEVLQVYAKDAINAANATGQIVNPMEVVAALAKAYQENKITDRDLAKIEVALGGKLRTVQLDALLKNFTGTYEEMMQLIETAAGSADKEVAIMLDTWQAKSDILKNTWTKFISDTINTRFFKNILDKATEALKFIGNLKNGIIELTAVLVPLKAILSSSAITKFFGTLAGAGTSAAGAAAGAAANAAANAAATAAGTTAGTTAAGTVAGGAVAGGAGAAVGGVAAIIGGAILAHMLTQQSADSKARHQAEQAVDAKSAADKILTLVSAYQNAAQGSREFESASAALAEALGLEGDAVATLNTEYGRLAQTKLDQSAQEAKEAMEAAENALHTKFNQSNYSIRKSWKRDETITPIIEKTLGDYWNQQSGTYKAGYSLEERLGYYESVVEAIKQIDEAVREIEDPDRKEAIENSSTMKDLLAARDNLSSYVGDYYEKKRASRKADANQEYALKLLDMAKGGNVDLLSRPLIDAAELVKAGWEDAGEGIATVFSGTYSNEKGNKFANFTPIMENMDGTISVLTPQALQTYADGVMNGMHGDFLNLKIGADFDDIDEAIDAAKELHIAHEEYFADSIEAIESGEEVADTVSSYADTVEKAKKAFSGEAEEIDNATNALERYKRAKQGDKDGNKKAEKDDNFKTVAGAFGTMRDEAKNGRYQSNAFQDAAALVLGQNYMSTHTTKEVKKHIDELQKMGVFNPDSAGTGLYNLIRNNKDVEKTADGYYAVADGLAAVKKNADGTFDFKITDNPEELEQVANALEVSATSLITMQQAMGVFDGSIDVGVLDDLLNKVDTLKQESEEETELNFKTNAEEVSKEMQGIKEEAEGIATKYAMEFAASMTFGATYGAGANNGGGNGDGNGGGNGGRASGDKNFKGGLVLVNEQAGGFNPELIEVGDKSFFVNGGRPALVSLPKGAVIHNATETRKLFAKDYMEVPHFETGTAPLPSGIAGRSGRVAGIGNGKGSAGSKDWWEKLQQYMEDLLEKAGDALDKQLEAIDAELFYLQYGKEVSEKATKLEEARMDLLEAEQELINAQTERTVRYFNAETGQWEWMADQRDIIKAQEELAERQKDYLKAQYDYLEDVWNELKDDIQKAIDGKKDVNIAKVLKQMLKSKAGGLTGNVEGVIGDLLNLITALSNGTALDSYDSGGIANGLGYMFKATKADEVVLNGKLSNAILSPKRSQQFADFTSSLERMFGMSAMMDKPQSRMGFSTTDYHGTNITINGMKVGSDMLNRPLSEVLSVLPIYCN